MERIIINKEIYNSLQALKKSYVGKNENKIQRDLAIFMYCIDKYKNLQNDYYNSISLKENSTKKERLINVLKFVGEPDKSESVYYLDWCDLLTTLGICEILSEDETKEISKKIEEILM